VMNPTAVSARTNAAPEHARRNVMPW
jgi:hypothetical protein